MQQHPGMNGIGNNKALDAHLRTKIRFDVEELWAVALNSNLEILATELIFRGHASGCLIHPREIFRFAIREGALSLAIAHSHPSGDHEPSTADLLMTRDLFLIGRFAQIPLVDHLVLSANGFSSMAALGHFESWRKLRSVRF